MTTPHLRLVGGKDMPSRKPKRGTPQAPRIAVETVGRQNLRAAVWKGQGGGRPLLFFNGIGVNLELAAPLHAALPDRDLVTFDMPGIGLSPVPRIPYRPWWVAHAAAKILDRYGYNGKVDVMGVSWGGLAAQQFAFQSAHRVNRVVLAATSPGALMIPGDLGVWSRLLNPRGFFDAEALTRGFAGLFGEQDGLPKGLAAKFRPPAPAGYAAQILAMTAWSSLPFLPFLKVPALIMMGDRDRVVPLINGRILNALIPNSRLHIVKDGGHFFPVTRQDQVAPVLREFLDEDRLERLRLAKLDRR
jgi:poly(3-hydroxyalkanoate) depolymerase